MKNLAPIPKYRPTPGTKDFGPIGRPAKPEVVKQQSKAVSSKVSAKRKEVEEEKETVGASAPAIIVSILVAMSAVSLVLWLAYAYKFPHSASGQLLIKVSQTDLKKIKQKSK